MSGAGETHIGGRALLVGRSGAIMATVLDDLASLGFEAEGSTDPSGVAEAVDGAGFALVAFGGGVDAETKARIRAALAAQNPALRFMDASAPEAVRRIADALAGRPDRDGVDLDGYLARIGYPGPREPTLETLAAVQEAHLAAIPFEAIDVVLGRGIDIAAAAVDAKLIGARRGGYCYEQNGLLRRALKALGFEVEGLMARVRWSAPADRLNARTHMTLRVRLEGTPLLVDVGFGAMVPPRPLRLDHDGPQETRHETFRLIPFGPTRMLQARIGERWISLYDFADDIQLDVDYEPANWLTSTHPDSFFAKRLIAARATPQARYALLGNRLTVRRVDGSVERGFLDADGIERALTEDFALEVRPEWRAMIEAAVAAGEEDAG